MRVLTPAEIQQLKENLRRSGPEPDGPPKPRPEIKAWLLEKKSGRPTIVDQFIRNMENIV